MQEPTRASGDHSLGGRPAWTASDSRRSTGFHARNEEIWIDGKRYWWQTFPTEPSWWNDERESFRRMAVVGEFEWPDVMTVSTELRDMLRSPLRLGRKPGHGREVENENFEEATRLARRCLSLSWMVGVALEHLNGPSELEGVEYMCQHNAIGMAEFMVREGWRMLFDLPPLVASAAIREAFARPDELHEADVS
jgi:hypothetical protein